VAGHFPPRCSYCWLARESYGSASRPSRLQRLAWRRLAVTHAQAFQPGGVAGSGRAASRCSLYSSLRRTHGVNGGDRAVLPKLEAIDDANGLFAEDGLGRLMIHSPERPLGAVPNAMYGRMDSKAAPLAEAL
jgi:hypothetical protein